MGIRVEVTVEPLVEYQYITGYAVVVGGQRVCETEDIQSAKFIKLCILVAQGHGRNLMEMWDCSGDDDDDF